MRTTSHAVQRAGPISPQDQEGHRIPQGVPQEPNRVWSRESNEADEEWRAGYGTTSKRSRQTEKVRRALAYVRRPDIFKALNLLAEICLNFKFFSFQISNPRVPLQVTKSDKLCSNVNESIQIILK